MDELDLLKKDKTLETEFQKEMRRFLPIKKIKQVVEQEGLWMFIVHLIEGFRVQLGHFEKSAKLDTK
jgi:hypothetical protein